MPYKQVTNVNIWGFDESVKASRLPRCAHPDETSAEVTKKTKALASCPQGSGHDCFLKGIIVQFDLCLPQYMWMQAERYHWFDIVSSQSKDMLVKMDVQANCNQWVLPQAIELVEQLKRVYAVDPTPENWQLLRSNIPMGFLLTARISTNYLQLKTIYNQRRRHRLGEWREFCAWLETLPRFMEWIGGNTQ
ncbi:MAG: hypothetical protein ACRKGH_02005 [Dehalogenimonas sp.]